PQEFNSLYWRVQYSLYKSQWDSPVFEAYNTIYSSPDTSDEYYTAVKRYLYHPFNKDGFRGIEFKKHRTRCKRILVIGDSFVYGMSAKPFYNSFYDILLSQGYMVYAAGIPGTDPAQYAAIAEKYIPIL